MKYQKYTIQYHGTGRVAYKNKEIGVNAYVSLIEIGKDRNEAYKRGIKKAEEELILSLIQDAIRQIKDDDLKIKDIKLIRYNIS